ncbi:MAG: plasmid mobilization protein [Alphaproteobacteria bacterium]
MKKLPDHITDTFLRVAKGLSTQTTPPAPVQVPHPANASKPVKLQATHTISLRVTNEEKAQLARDSAGMSRSAYMRERLFGAYTKPRKTRGKFPVKDYDALGRVLGLLGRSNLADDLGQLDWAIENGVVQIDAPTALAIKMACVNIAAMRADLIIALGLKTERVP